MNANSRYVEPYPYYPPERCHCGRPFSTVRINEIFTAQERRAMGLPTDGLMLVEWCPICTIWRRL